MCYIGLARGFASSTPVRQGVDHPRADPARPATVIRVAGVEPCPAVHGLVSDGSRDTRE